MWSPPPPPTSLSKPLQLCLKMPPLWQRDNDRFSLASRKRLGHTAGGAASLRVTKTKRPRNQLLNEPLWNFHRGRPSAASTASTADVLQPVKSPKTNESPFQGLRKVGGGCGSSKQQIYMLTLTPECRQRSWAIVLQLPSSQFSRLRLRRLGASSRIYLVLGMSLSLINICRVA